ncbi:RyR domain-containing protein [Vibrio owensii]|uniref:RyR domain-containing protein n=1 Tax=Vibrio owensii TaxID=696485 RepID=UPI0038CEB5E8
MTGRTAEEQSLLIQEIASIAHEVNAALCAAFGDNSQPPWNEAPKWQRNSCVSGVLFHIEHPFATPEDSHERWLQEKLADGWVYDEVKDAQAKTHPCCVPYYQLPPEQRAKDYVFKQIVHSLMHRSSTSYVQALKEARNHE